MPDPTPASGAPARVRPRPRRAELLAAVTLLVTALNLRPALAGLTPLLPEIRRASGLSSAGAGLLTTLPLCCFGLFAFATPRLTRRLGRERLLVALLAALAGGIAVRLVTGTASLFVGTILAGAAIAVGNVLLPSILKRDFPGRAATMSGLYAMTLSGGAALAAGTIVPLSHLGGIGWRPALGLWALPVALVALLRLPGARRHDLEPAPRRTGQLRRLAADPLAWWVSGFMGVQSLEFYTTLTWVPTLLQDHGASPAASGLLLSLASLASIPAASLAPFNARRLGERRVVALAIASCATGFAGLAVAPVALGALWLVLIGAGQGTAISLALGFIVLRAPDPDRVGDLATLAQGTGYLFAAIGPVAIGALHQLSGGWRLPIAVLVALLGLQLAAGLASSVGRHVGETRPTGAPGTAVGEVPVQLPR